MTVAPPARLRLLSEAPVALLCYCVSSIAMTIMNKYVLSGHKFHLNLLLLTIQVSVGRRHPVLTGLVRNLGPLPDAVQACQDPDVPSAEPARCDHLYVPCRAFV